MTDVLIGAGLGVATLAVGGLLFLYWLGWLPKKQKVTLPASWPTDLYWVVEEQYRRSPFNPDFMANALHPREDPVEDVLFQAGKHDEQRQYEQAKREIVAAYEDLRVPALWAQSLVRAYREAYAVSQSLHAEQVLQSLRNRASSKSTRWEAEVIHRQLPN